MNKLYKILLVLIFGINNLSLAQNFEKCATQKLMDETFKKHPEFKIQYEQSEIRLGQEIAKKLQSGGANQRVFPGPVVIPIVFHVVLTAGQQANVTDAMILAQLATLNNDYAGTNSDSANIPSAFQAVRGHSQVSFCLAQRTPAGLAANGIDRIVSSTLSNSSQTNDPVKSTAAGGADAWDPTKYINVWLCNFTSSTLLGYASFPIGSPEGGAPLSQQGVAVLAQSINGGTAAPYNKGRTLTHELGHYFWLRHTWGDGAGCANDFPNTPGIDDTPLTSGPYFGCAAQSPNVVTLSSACAGVPNPPGKMFQNYMDYTDDACMTMFTNGQNTRIEAAINTYRASLLTSDGCQPPSGFNFGTVTTTTSACPAGATMTVNIPTTSTGGFVNPITLAATAGVPVGTTVSFAANPVAPGATSVATLNNANTLSAGTYNVTVTGTATGAGVKTTTISFVITAGAGPVLTTNTVATTVCAPATASFSVATAAATVTYQWQSAPTVGGTYTNISTATSASYTTAATNAGMNGMGFRCVVSTQCGTTTSTNALLTVNTAAAITTQPTNQTACTGGTATFTTAASGTGVTYQWQSGTSATGPWTNVGTNSASYTTAPLTITTPTFYQVVVTTTTCPLTVTSNVVTLGVSVTTAINTQPTAQTVCAGATATYTVSAVGTSISYQWQMATAAAPTVFNNVGTNSNTYTTPATIAAMSGNIYRVRVSGSCNGDSSNNVTLTVNTAALITSVTPTPADATVCNGATISFASVTSGTGATYQWQVSTTAVPTFTNIPLATSANYTTPATTPSMSGNRYRLVVTTTTCAATINSAPITITVNTVAVIGTQPAPQSACIPQTATFNVAATGTGLTYQWQIALAATPTVFTDITGATNASYTTGASALTMNGNLYRVSILSTCGAGVATVSNSALLTVTNPVSITLQPTATSGCIGDNYTFTANAASPGNNITYQWQISNTGAAGSFTNLAGANGTSVATANITYPITSASSLQNGTYYRVYFTVPCGTGISADTSAVGKLTLSLKPTIVLTAPATSSINASVNQSLFTTISPANFVGTFNWTKNGAVIPNTLASTSIILPVDGAGIYQVSIRDATTGCISSSREVPITVDQADNIAKGKLFVYPNPVSNTMFVRFNFPNVGTTGTVLNIYDEKGSRVMSVPYTLTGTTGRMSVNMSKVQLGTYLVYLMDASGKKLASTKVVKVQ